MHSNEVNTIKILKVQNAELDSIQKLNFLMGLDSCQEFFISRTEVTNSNWKEFLYYLKDKGRMDEYNANILDSTVWSQRLAYNEPYVEHYHQHPAYADYPAVGMTLKQAKAYADWLTEIWSINEKVKKSGVKITFSVPTKKQWIRAARNESRMIYPWGGPYCRNNKGCVLANFKKYDAANIHFNREINKYEVIALSPFRDEANITASVPSYSPNQFGIYNMSGNVAELVSDDSVAMGGSWNDTGYDVRVESEQPAIEPMNTIGFRVVAVIGKKVN